jgi:hypothetical protein
MTEQEAFQQIDIAIRDFKQNEGQQKVIHVSTTPKSDWLTFNWRQLSWTENDIHYLIEIYPNFNQRETITDWTMYAAAYFDQDKKRYYANHKVAEHKTIDFIASNAASLLSGCIKYLSNVQRRDIPFAVALH